MNKPNNKRKKESQEKIERAFIELIQTKNVEEVTVTDICNLTHLNRSTFYANYLDIYDLIDKIKIKMIEDFFDIYKDETSGIPPVCLAVAKIRDPYIAKLLIPPVVVRWR